MLGYDSCSFDITIHTPGDAATFTPAQACPRLRDALCKAFAPYRLLNEQDSPKFHLVDAGF